MEISLSLTRTIHGAFFKVANHFPHFIALSANGKHYTYQELNAHANRLAKRLLKLNVKPNTLIAVALDRTPELIISILAILKIGCAYVPLDHTQPTKRLRHILDDCKTPLLITLWAYQEKFSDFTGQFVLLEKIRQGKVSNYPDICVASEPSDLAYVIYTSGTTGQPKGVLIQHQSVFNYIQWFANYSHAQPGTRVDFSANFIFDLSITTLLAPLLLGFEIVLCPEAIKLNLRDYLLHLQNNHIHLIKITPSYFKLLTQEAMDVQVALPDLKTIILGGEILPTIDCQQWLTLYPTHTLYNEYGPTEATVGVSQFKVTKDNVSPLGKTVPIGQAGDNIELWILNENKEIVAEGEIGELYISGLCVAKGYLNQTSLTRTCFIPSPFDQTTTLYQTGDLCRYLPDKNIEYIGRKDLQIKIHGHRIEPNEIEICLASHPLVKEAMVLTCENQVDEKQLIAYFTPKDTRNVPSASTLRNFLRMHLPKYMIPSLFITHKAFQITPSGKLDRNVLLKYDFSFQASSKSMIANDLEETIVEAFKSVFKLKNIQAKDNFFELGGHSLFAAKIIHKLTQMTGKEISLRDLYDAETPARLAQKIENAKPMHMENKLIATLSSKKHLPLSDSQFLFWLSRIIEKSVEELNMVARKRICGNIHVEHLHAAFNALFKKHDILNYRTSKFLPYQSKQKEPYILISINEIGKRTDNREALLQASLKELINYNFWQSDAQIIARVFYLEKNLFELQICVPHFYSDNISIDLLFDELSKYYFNLTEKDTCMIKHDLHYQAFIQNEQHYMKLNLKRDFAFWKKYLKETNLIKFANPQIQKQAQADKLSYSTFLELPEAQISKLQKMCTEKKLTLMDMLLAAVTLSLQKNITNKPKALVMNIIKSTRDADIDDAIGYFLRIDPIKVHLNENTDLLTLSNYIQKSILETAPYQKCSSIIKIGCMHQNPFNRMLFAVLLKIPNFLPNKLLAILKTRLTILAMCIPLLTLRKKNHFYLQINFFNNFITKEESNNTWGKFAVKEVEPYQYDLLKTKGVLDISFLKQEDRKVNVVISANLQAQVRQKIGEDILKQITLLS